MTEEKEQLKMRVIKLTADMDAIGRECIALAEKHGDKDLDQFGQALLGTSCNIQDAVL